MNNPLEQGSTHEPKPVATGHVPALNTSPSVSAPVVTLRLCPFSHLVLGFSIAQDVTPRPMGAPATAPALRKV
jgi:hypothetical protein